jgi:hypothetical protein
MVIDILSYYRTPETVKQTYCKDKTTYKSGIDFQNCAEVQHQETCNRLENKILGKVT